MIAAIVDDEPHARMAIRNLLAADCAEVLQVHEAGSVAEGKALINSTQPVLVFLDIKLQDGTGFDLLGQVRDQAFQVIFITAYDAYAIKAFKFNAVDYLVKPVDPHELKAAVLRAKEQVGLRMAGKVLSRMERNQQLQRLAIPSLTKVSYVEVADIIRCESEGSYTHVHFLGAAPVVSTRPLKVFEELLSDRGFFRVHRSHLINLSLVREYHKLPQDGVLMTDGSKVDISRQKRAEFSRIMAGLQP